MDTEKLMKKIREDINYRFWVSTVVVLLTFSLWLMKTIQTFLPILILYSIFNLLNLVYLFLIRQKKVGTSRWLAPTMDYFGCIFDVTAITLVLLYTELWQSHLALLYLVPILIEWFRLNAELVLFYLLLSLSFYIGFLFFIEKSLLWLSLFPEMGIILLFGVILFISARNLRAERIQRESANQRLQSLYEEIKKREEKKSADLLALDEITATIVSHLDLPMVLDKIIDTIQVALDIKICAIFLLEAPQKELKIKAFRGIKSETAERLKLKIGEGIVGLAVKEKKTLAIDDLQNDPRVKWKGLVRVEGWRSCLVAPLQARVSRSRLPSTSHLDTTAGETPVGGQVDQLEGEVIGAIAIFTSEEYKFSEEEVSLFSTFARNITIAVGNARLFSQQQTQIAQLSALNKIGEIIGTELELDRLLEQIYQQVKLILRAPNVSIIFYNENAHEFEVVLKYDGGVRQEGYRFPFGEGLTTEIIRIQQPILTSNYPKECEWLKLKPIGIPAKPWLGVPLKSRGKILGAMIVWNYKDEQMFDENDLQVLSILASQAGVAIHNARLFADIKRQVNEISGLCHLASITSSTLDLNKLLRQLIVETGNLIGVEKGTLMLYEPTTRELVAQYEASFGATEEQIKAFRVKVDEPGFSSMVFNTGEPFVSNDAQNDPRVIRRFVEMFKVRQLLTVPVRSAEQTLGVIHMANKKVGRFDEEDVRLLSTITPYFASGITNARLYQEIRGRLRDLTTLYEMQTVAGLTLSLEEVLTNIATMLEKTFNYTLVTVLLKDKKKNELVARAISPEKTSEGLLGSVVKIDENSMVGWVARTGEPLLAQDVSQEKRYREVISGIRSEFALPLQIKDELFGVLDLESEQLNGFDSQTMDLLTNVAQQISSTIERAILYEKLEKSYFETIRSLATAVDAKDPFTKEHSERVRFYATEIARQMGLSEEEVKRLNLAGLLHDIGKIGTSEFILKKPSALTDEEYEEVKLHPIIGYKILEGIEAMEEISPMVRFHHEFYGGKGYPLGLKGENIPLGARIIAVADAFESMTSDRPYRKAFSEEEALHRLKKASGSQFDPQVIEAFLEWWKKNQK
ncbi:MAG: GAF domain-containing protein [Candidatus Edwardsbacteria bacterium]